MNDRRRKILKLIARVSIFGSLSIILYMVPGLQFGLPFTPGFLKIHLDEIPVLLAGFAYGTPTAVALIVIKSIFKLITDIPETMGVGVLADFIYGCALCIPACLIYNHKRTFSGVIIGISVGLASNFIFSCIVGLYTIYPLYANIYGTQTIVNMFKVFDNSINSITDFKIAYEFLLPFNFIKDAIVILVMLLIYKDRKSVV